MIDLLPPDASLGEPSPSERQARGTQAGECRSPELVWCLSGTGPVTVVLESGLGASSVGWSTVAAELGVVARVLRYDRAGLGASSSTGSRRGLASLTEDLLRVVGSAGVTRPVVLVGHSWGASIVRLAAQRRPDLIAGLVLLEPVPDRWLQRWGSMLRPGGALVYRAMQVAARTGLIGLLARTGPARRWFTGRRGALPDDVRAELFAEVCRPSHHVAGCREFTGMVVGSRADLTGLVPSRRVPYPVLVVSGGWGNNRLGWVRPRLRAAHAGLALAYGGEHVVLPGAGHLLPREHPVGVADLVARLCRQTVDSRGADVRRPDAAQRLFPVRSADPPSVAAAVLGGVR